MNDEAVIKLESVTKRIPNTAIGILLGVLLAGGIWLAARVPQGENVVLYQPSTPVENGQKLDNPYQAGFVPNRGQGNEAASENMLTLLTGTKEAGADSAPAVHTTVTPSCSEGPVGSDTFVWPSENHYLSGNDYGPDHPGIDIAAGEGVPVYAADSGIITAKGNDEAGYGNVIQIDHGNSYSTVYAHLSVIEVSVCQGVYTGQLIGKAGNTGNSRGTHLHFEVIKDGWYINPWLVLP